VSLYIFGPCPHPSSSFRVGQLTKLSDCDGGRVGPGHQLLPDHGHSLLGKDAPPLYQILPLAPWERNFNTLKGSRQWESRGVWNVSICPNLARPAAIEVCLPFNFAVVFDFTYFRFRPSKAKSIGDVLTNRHNAANCCLHREWKNSAESLGIGILALRQYIDATIHPAPLGNGVQICSVYNFSILFRGFFFLCAAHPLMAQTDSVRQ
jgi:hypothetical protein